VPPAIDFSSANPFWNGYAKFTNKINARIITMPLDQVTLDPNNEALIIIPYNAYSSNELVKLREFIRSGGKVILMDDFRYGNAILEFLGLSIQIINDSVLIDPLFNYKDGKLPTIIDFAKYPETINISRVTLNYASALQVTSGDIEILAYSSSFSYLDTNLNGFKDEFEPTGPYPVLAKAHYGKGIVYILSDPSIIINSMVEMNDNFKLIRNLVGSRVAVLDQYHLTGNLHYKIRSYIMSFIEYIVSRENLPYTIALIPLISIVVFIKLVKRVGAKYG